MYEAGVNFVHCVRSLWKEGVWMRTMDRPLTMKSQTGGAVIIRCIYKSETTSPARLSSLPSHCIIPPFWSCQLAPALLINCTTQSRWTARPRKQGNNPQFSLWSFVLQVSGLWNSVCLPCPTHFPHWAHTHMLTPQAEEGVASPEGRKSGNHLWCLQERNL